MLYDIVALPHPMNPAVREIINAINMGEIWLKLLAAGLEEFMADAYTGFGVGDGGSSTVSLL